MSQLRSVSSGTDVLSLTSKSARATVPQATAPASYVSIPEADSLCSTEIDRTVKVSPGAIRLINAFLDQVLYDVLVKAQSVGLGALRAAVPLILKQRLGRAAIKLADEELQDYLDEDELEVMQNSTPVLDPRQEFDVDLAWKLTRLRCMVYSKLGDMEEEDEEESLEDIELRDHIDQVSDPAYSAARLAPPAAIFLTTILEFLAEQAMCIAATHAMRRNKHLQAMTKDTIPDEHHAALQAIHLEEIDMSGIGKEGPLIRLWRSWKGSIRTGGSGTSRPTTPSLMSPMTPDSPEREFRFPSVPVMHQAIQEEPRSDAPANIPLPMSDRDVEEIESPDAKEAEAHRPSLSERKSTSMLVMPGQFPEQSASSTPTRPPPTRRRSRSVPSVMDHSSPVTWQNPRKRPQPIDPKSGQAGPVLPEQGSEDHHAENHSGARGVPTSATLASLAGALGVEAARASRKSPQPTDENMRGGPSPPTEAHASIGSPADFENMHIPMRMATSTSDLAITPTHEEPQDPEDLALSSDDEGRNHTAQRDSGIGAVETAHLPAQHPDIRDSQYSEAPSELEPPRHVVAPSTRSSNLGYATIFNPGDTTSSTYSSARTSRMDAPEPMEDVTPPRPMPSNVAPPTSAWPAVVPKRGASLEKPREQRQDPTLAAQQYPAPPPIPTQGEQYVPRYATSAHATQNAHSRSASAQTRPSTSGSATARRQHMRLRSDADQAWDPEEHNKGKKSLDLLIDSDQTLHYTLTPPNATGVSQPVCDGYNANVPQVAKKSQTQELADFFKNTAPPGEEVRPKSSKSAREGLNGLRANPLTPPAVPVSQTQVNGSQPISPSKPRNPIGEPREPRVVKNNTRDLADYARSTGPEHDAQLPKAITTRPHTGTQKSDMSLREKALADESRPNTSKSANRLKYQARDAKVPKTNETSDLIDFIREGPPRAPGEHRIDRHVAPFRTTMDSDDLNALAPPPDVDSKPRTSDASFQESSFTTKSMPSTINSRTGLLDSTNRANRSNGVSKQPVIPETDGMPKRKQTRVRDPYAIDYSDEEQEEVEDTYSPPPRRKGEESLVDFLRNTAPPPGMTTQPILAAIPSGSPTQPEFNQVKRTPSGNRLKDFFPGSKSNDEGATNGNSRPVNVARESSPHLTQSGSKMDKYRPTTTTHAAHVDRNRPNNAATANISKPVAKIEPLPYDPNKTSLQTGTSDLAAFLKNSEPPPGMNDKPVQKLGRDVPTARDQAGFMKFFQRRGSVRK
jgi:hypothetical protein